MIKSRVAVLIPCYNESATIQQVIKDFKQHLPEAMIYVYDNHSTDNTAELAKAMGAELNYVTTRGKGHVMRRMFADIDADIYVMVDGDATYDASHASRAIQLLQDRMLDMVVCVRKAIGEHSFRLGHQLGNKCFTRTINFLFGHRLKDIFSGYRIFSRRFVKSFPAISQGFEIEAEMTIHALQLGLPIAEIEAPYQERPSGSLSKLKTIKDGIRILRTVFLLFLYVRPMALFGNLFLILLVLSFVLGTPIVLDFIHTGLVPRLPTALLAASLGLLAALCLACGMVLDSMSRARLETKKLWYLLIKPCA
ncbi:MAG: glycosyltransferase family 2 protein [Gammaproteobacteria bacterium]